MQIVIEIPKSEIPKQQDIIEISLHFIDGKVCGAGGYGFDVLPKGHGRLIDVNDLLDDISLEDNDYNRDVNMGEIITLENIDRIPTIIEADKAESEDKE